MKKLLVFFLTLFLFSSVYAEAKVVDKLEYRDGIAYSVGESEKFSGQLVTIDIDRKTKTNYRGGIKKNETSYVVINGFLVKNLEATYNDYGHEKTIINYKNGKEFGRIVNEYYKNKQLKTTKFYTPDKSLSEVHEPPNGYLLTQTSFYKNGNEESSLNFDSSKAYKIIQKYFYESGNLKREELYLGGENTNCDTRWGKKGQIIEKNECYFYNPYKINGTPYAVHRIGSYIEKLAIYQPYLLIWALFIVVLIYTILGLQKKHYSINKLAWLSSLALFTLWFALFLGGFNYKPHPDNIFTMLTIYGVLIIHYLWILINGKDRLLHLIAIPILITAVSIPSCASLYF
jgi:antitoxin component YwqK of YwqJK toxin-antitoxin module